MTVTVQLQKGLTTMDLTHAEDLGRAAFEAGQPAAPILHPEIAAAIEGLPVGGGAEEIFRAYSDGWTEANLAAPVPSTVTAAFEVFAGTTVDVELDTTDMTPDEIAEYLEQNAQAGVSVCHQCAHDISDPQVGELAGFSFDGRHFGRDPETGRWVESK